ncbi:hypothetical protein GCM10009837_02540 [Streptomyces durmitorensis]|uniref:Pentapeptide repeat-containing protein n=1 Tax=Streptomyces durmitorensis TaxID=319947 RepID=A0ABY4Q9A4_9ACTN|nr:pentapeptide repeat-containing protein [Streptomyces durmitorensis]UQT61818.1 pentapeptide repeat-containing protein [Streptomyces durmitorensis]
MERDAYLAALAPGGDVDHRGTTLDDPLLASLLDAVRDPETGQPRFGRAIFVSAIFTGAAVFESVMFMDVGLFRSAIFEGGAGFRSTTFGGGADFESVIFTGYADFESATFKGDDTVFRSAIFRGRAGFDSATFESDAAFGSAIFKGSARFSATFQRSAWFRSAKFQDDVSFDSATFTGYAEFTSAIFEGSAGFSTTFSSGSAFDSAIFTGRAGFDSAIFEHIANFTSATFEGDAAFFEATFEGYVKFRSATFERDAHFTSSTFEGDAYFSSSAFEGDAVFDSATFSRNADFSAAVFERSAGLGPLVCAGQVTLSGAVFSGPVTIAIATRRLLCRRTRWSSTAALRLRHATVDFTDAVFEYPLSISAESDPFTRTSGEPIDETALAGDQPPSVRLASLRGVDAAHLVLADIDLSRCLLTGTVHLDQLRLEGACSFATVPRRTHWRRGHPVRFTERRTLAEEHHWRASQASAVRGWNVAVLGSGDVEPVSLAPVYRQLRKSFEDSKNEPGAADFYYGEMEMRRCTPETPRAERGLLTAYWAVSGYGLRATRALVWLLLAMSSTVLAMMLWGLPASDPKSESTGRATGQDTRPATDVPEPSNPVGPLHERVSTERFESGLRVVVNSVIFRSSGQDLTTSGTYTEMASRLFEPVLLGLAVLAVRGRVKR